MNKIVFLISILSLSMAMAQEEKHAEKSKARVEMSFEDELVKGDTMKPDSNFLTQGKSFNYKKLIRLRENFIPEAQKGRGEFSEK